MIPGRLEGAARDSHLGACYNQFLMSSENRA